MNRCEEESVGAPERFSLSLAATVSSQARLMLLGWPVTGRGGGWARQREGEKREEEGKVQREVTQGWRQSGKSLSSPKPPPPYSLPFFLFDSPFPSLPCPSFSLLSFHVASASSSVSAFLLLFLLLLFQLFFIICPFFPLPEEIWDVFLV